MKGYFIHDSSWKGHSNILKIIIFDYNLNGKTYCNFDVEFHMRMYSDISYIGKVCHKKRIYLIIVLIPAIIIILW